MAFEVRHTNSAGVKESQSVSPSDVLSLIAKITRLGGSEIFVVSAKGERWTASEAETHLNAAGFG